MIPFVRIILMGRFMSGWLFWDPDFVAFTLPFIKHPITWYGILFALGFFLGYYLLLALFKRFLCFYPQFVAADVSDWKEILKSKTLLAKKLISRMSSGQKEAISKEKLSQRLEKDLIELLNTLLNEEDLGKSDAFVNHPLFRFANRFLKPETFRYLKNRLILEKHLSPALKPLKKRAMIFSERLTIYMIVSTVVGARLGHIFFYENWIEYLLHPIMIIKTWEGGLASHGAIIGILLGIVLFYFRSRKEYPMISIPRLFDLIIIPGLCPSILIRVGNFINQEILGTESLVPWAIIFGHPADGSPPIPRHPAQLYEAVFYLLVFWVFLKFFPKWLFPVGRISGIFFIVIFLFRILVEFVKIQQSYWMSQEIFTMGQLLSVPMIFLGIILLVWGKKQSSHNMLERG